MRGRFKIGRAVMGRRELDWLRVSRDDSRATCVTQHELDDSTAPAVLLGSNIVRLEVVNGGLPSPECREACAVRVVLPRPRAEPFHPLEPFGQLEHHPDAQRVVDPIGQHDAFRDPPVGRSEALNPADMLNGAPEGRCQPFGDTHHSRRYALDRAIDPIQAEESTPDEPPVQLARSVVVGERAP